MCMAVDLVAAVGENPKKNKAWVSPAFAGEIQDEKS